jgi:hypothetical protein
MSTSITVGYARSELVPAQTKTGRAIVKRNEQRRRTAYESPVNPKKKSKDGIITMSSYDLKFLAQYNNDARISGLEQAKLVIRKCLACQKYFESHTARRCGCTVYAESQGIGSCFDMM